MFTKFALLSSVLAVALAQASHRCFDDQGPVSECLEFMNDFCQDVSTIRLLARDSHSRCYIIPGKSDRCNFTAFDSTGFTAAPTYQDCVNVVQPIILKCRGGGVGTSSSRSFTYTVDYNSGGCPTNSG